MSNKNKILILSLILAGILSFFLHWILAAIIGLFLYFLVIISAVFIPSWGFFLPTTHTLQNKKAILLTFDDGPNPEITPKILKILKEYQALAIFFCIGNKIQQYPELVAQMEAEGHVIANHTWSHLLHWGFLPKNKVEAEIFQTEQVIKNSKKWFRPPFGVTNPQIASVLKNSQLRMMTWSFRTYDTRFKFEYICNQVKKNLAGGQIVLMHDTVAFAPELTTFILKEAKNKQLTFQNPHELT